MIIFQSQEARNCIAFKINIYTPKKNPNKLLCQKEKKEWAQGNGQMYSFPIKLIPKYLILAGSLLN